MNARVAALRTVSPYGSQLRWWLREGVSVRAYELGAATERSFCVSTRSSEAMLVLSGEVWIEVGPRRQALRADSGDVLVTRARTAHLCSASKGARFVVLDLPPQPGHAAPLALIRAEALPARLLQTASEVFEETRFPLAEQLRSAGTEIESLLGQARALDVEAVHHTRRLEGVKSMLEGAYTEPLTLGSAARQFHLERDYLVRAFKQNFGVPPLAYVQHLRMEHFVWESLRRAARVSHTRTAQEAGFGDYSTFCRKMAALFGGPPSRLIRVVSTA